MIAAKQNFGIYSPGIFLYIHTYIYTDRQTDRQAYIMSVIYSCFPQKLH